MGTYSELYIANYPVYPNKSAPDARAMTLFRDRDKKIYKRRLADRNPIGWGHATWDADETETVVEYSATVREVRDRLNVMGFTLDRVRAEFENVKADYVKWLKQLSEISDSRTEEISLLERSTLERFMGAFKEIITSGIHYVHFVKQTANASQLAIYILEDSDDYYWHFPCRDIRCFFRALVEVSADSDLVTQDLTDLVDGEYFDQTDDLVEMALVELKGDYAADSRIILLTEGTTDAEVLQESLKLLYPHLADYYSFMDIAVRAPGGAGSLVHVVKSFAGAGIENRTIALFDNDAAGHSAIALLQTVALPSNIAAITYPDIEIARNYPTQGPNGKSLQDVNGSACSIELYFGADVLISDGGMVPVQWRAYDDRVKRYQGEIQQKDLLKKKFLKKVDESSSIGAPNVESNWEDMTRLLQSIFQAFNNRQSSDVGRTKWHLDER